MKIKSLINIFKTIYYELKSEFVFEKNDYVLKGYCSKCGDCCRFMYSLDNFTEKDFKLLQTLYPKYKRFKIIGEDCNKNLIFACSIIKEDNICPDYNNRLKMCKNYPNPKKILAGGKLYKRCTYKLTPKKEFENYLK